MTPPVPPIPCHEPTHFVAGDTVSWTYDTVYSRAPGGVLSYAINGAQRLPWDPIWIVSLVGTVNTVKIPGASTKDLGGGTFDFRRIVTLSSDRYSDVLPALRIAANPATMKDGDGRPWQEVAIVAIQHQLAGTATAGMQSYMVDGRQVIHYAPEQLVKLLNRFQAQLNRIRRDYRPKQRLVTFTPQRPLPIPFYDGLMGPWRQ